MHRRTVFRLLAASSVGAMLPWLRTRAAAADPGEVPRRVLFLELGHGARRGTWEPLVAGPTDPGSTQVVEDWSFRGPMVSLQPYRSRVTLFQNLDMVSAAVDPTEAGDAHDNGDTHMLVADDRLTGELAGGVSIDQRIAAALNEEALLTRLRSAELGVMEDSEASEAVFIHHRYAQAGQKLPFVIHVPDMWSYLFPDPLDSGSAANQAELARKGHVYDFVRGDYERLIAQLGKTDQAKIQAMLDLRSDLQKSLTLHNDRAANRPAEEEITGPYGTIDDEKSGGPDNRRWHTKAPLVGRLMGAALHTDTTRVGNLFIELPPGYEFGYVDGASYDGVETSDWHDLTHKVSGDQPDLVNPAARAAIDAMEKQTYDALAGFLAMLDGLPETDGKSMLDHTLVVACSHIAEGSHDVTRLPWMVIGDAQGALRTGQYIRFPITEAGDPKSVGSLSYPDDAEARIAEYRGRPHNDLLVTVAQAMGVPLDSFGRALPESKGVIAEMLA